MKRVLCILALVALAQPSSQAFNLVDNSVGPKIAVCPCCVAILNPWNVVQLPAGGAAALGHRATLLADYPGVNVAIGAAAPGTMTIDSYYAWCRGLIGGAHITARYDDGDGVNDWALPGPGNPTSYRWIQEINTNKPLGGTTQPYIDPRPNDDQGIPLPYYWTDPEAIFRFTNGAAGGGACDILFRDTPSRECTQYVWWRADLFLTSENRFTDPQNDPLHVITIYDGVSWGFELFPSLAKLIRTHIYDLIFSTTETPLFWTTGIAQSHVYGTTNVMMLHPDGVFTNQPGQSFEDYGERHESYHGEFHLPSSYLFSVAIPDNGKLSVVINDLDLDMHTSVHVPIIQMPGVQFVSMTINLAEDLLVILDSELTLQRSDTALYVGSFSGFDPVGAGFTVLGGRTITVDHGFTEVQYSIAQAKMLEDGAAVTVVDKIATTSTTDLIGCFYVEEPNRSCGIRVVPADMPTESIFIRGSTLRVDGIMATTPAGERYIDRGKAQVGPDVEPLKPLGMTNKALGGGSPSDMTAGVGQVGPVGGVGLNNVGTYAVVWGRLIGGDGVTYVEIDDGSGVGVRVDITALPSPTIQSPPYSVFRGMSSLYDSPDGPTRLLLAIP